MADEFHVGALRSFCFVCGVLIFKNGYQVSSRVGDMSRNFDHLFDVINMQHKFVIHVYEQGKISW